MIQNHNNNVTIITNLNNTTHMTSKKLSAGAFFPSTVVPQYLGGTLDLAKSKTSNNWRLVLVYRGKHCPLCSNYLKTLNELLPELNDLGVDVVAVSADSEQRAKAQLEEINPTFDIAYDLSIEQMKAMNLYISNPRSPEESDRPFAEPGIFLINAEGRIQVVDISNAPFARPDLKSFVMGIKFIKNPTNNYPIRGTYND